MATDMKVTAIAPWFGSNRTLARHVGEELAGCPWVGVFFAGCMTELRFVKARTIVVSDAHENIINLARVIGSGELRPTLIDRLQKKLFHPTELREAQQHCLNRMKADGLFSCDESMEPIDVAVDYFVAVWMGRSAKAGTKKEFEGYLPIRWNANGGDSNTRYRSAVASLNAWGAILERCNFDAPPDCFEFAKRVKDTPETGLYSDSPFPGVGEEYLHTFTVAMHRRWAGVLTGFRHARIVCRFYDHPLIRELYPEPHWTWRYLTGGRDQANQTKPEVLIINGLSFAT